MNNDDNNKNIYYFFSEINKIDLKILALKTYILIMNNNEYFYVIFLILIINLYIFMVKINYIFLW